VKSFKAVFDGPASGWLTVTLEAPGQRYEFWPSHVPHDSVSMLAAALLSVLEHRDAIVPWNDEPAVHEFRFAVAEGGASLTVVAVRPRPHGEIEREPVFTVSGSPPEVVRPLWRALREVESRFKPDEYQREWHERFPAADVAEVGRRLSAARSDHP
jgi:hypothetical protein